MKEGLGDESKAGASKGGGGQGGLVVQPDYGVVVAEDARRKGSTSAGKARAAAEEAWPKGLADALRSRWPWFKNAFSSIQAPPPMLKPRRRLGASQGMLGDRKVELKHRMPVAGGSPLPSTSDAPLWRRLVALVSHPPHSTPTHQHARVPRHRALWGRSHDWGPSDKDLDLAPALARARRLAQATPNKAKVRVAGTAEERGRRSGGRGGVVWVSRNSPWAPSAGLLTAHDPAGKRLEAAGINVDSDMGVI